MDTHPEPLFAFERSTRFGEMVYRLMVKIGFPRRVPEVGKKLWTPSPAEIRAACAEIRSEWDEREEQVRRAGAYRAVPAVLHGER